MTITIYTDGGCSGNPGPGGWAYRMLLEGNTKERSGGDSLTTNNKMELTAVIRALEDVSSHSEWSASPVHLYTDSQYVQKGITQWIFGWERNGWLTAAKKPVKNRELWQELRELTKKLQVEWHWVKGHAGHEHNEACDAMVQVEIAKHK